MVLITRPQGNKTAGVCGILFALLSAAIFPVLFPNFPPPLGGNAEDIVAFHSAHPLPFLIANYLGVLAMVPGLVKLSYLTAIFRRADRPDGWLSWFVLSTGVWAFTVGTCDLLAYQAISFLATPELQAGAKALSDLASAGFALFLIAQFGFVVAIVWATFITRALPQWVAVSGCVVALFSLVGSVGANLSQPIFWAGGGPMSGISLGVFLGWFVMLDLYFLSQRGGRQ